LNSFSRIRKSIVSIGVPGGCPGVQRQGAKMTIKFLLVHWSNWPEPQL
jgi:hypothetical protein